MAELLTIAMSFAPCPRKVHSTVFELPANAKLRDALALLADDPVFKTVAHLKWHCSVWGTKASPDQTLQAHDRIELCRALRVDPKVARRERFALQGARTSGLFAQRRPGAKSGY